MIKMRKFLIINKNNLRINILIILLCLTITTGVSAKLSDRKFSSYNICDQNGCNCSAPIHHSWFVVNCTFGESQTVDLNAGAIPNNVQEINLSGGEEIRFLPQVFLTLIELQKVRVTKTKKLLIKKHSFVNLTTNRLFLDVFDCGTVIIETGSFQDIKGPLSALVSRHGYLVLQKNSFGYLAEITISDIALLELQEGAFSFKSSQVENHGPATTIHIKNVIIRELASNTFSSSAAEITIEDSEMRYVHKNAFNANEISALRLLNSSFHQISTFAINEKVLIEQLEITDCRIRKLESNAITSAVGNLKILHTMFANLESNGISIDTASISIINSTFENIANGGLSFKKWNQLIIYNNFFIKISNQTQSFYLLDELPDNVDNIQFNFSSNIIKDVSPTGLAFLMDIMSNDLIYSEIRNNYFFNECKCQFDKYIEQFDTFLDSNYCTMPQTCSSSLDVTTQHITMKYFNVNWCKNKVNCQNNNSIDDNDIDNNNNNIEATVKDYSRIVHISNKKERASQPFIVIFTISVAFVTIVFIIATIVTFLNGEKLWSKHKHTFQSFKSHWFNSNIHEDKQTELPDHDITTITIVKNEDDIPNELTFDLLQMLRKQLDDPDTYNDAKEMIEKLYERFAMQDDYELNQNEHLYEELQLRKSNNNLLDDKNDFSSGPSSLPFSQDVNEMLDRLLNEYSEPIDKETEVHLYSEVTNSLLNNYGEGTSHS